MHPIRDAPVREGHLATLLVSPCSSPDSFIRRGQNTAREIRVDNRENECSCQVNSQTFFDFSRIEPIADQKVVCVLEVRGAAPTPVSTIAIATVGDP